MDQKAALVYVVSGKAVYTLVGFRLFADSNVLRFTVYAIRIQHTPLWHVAGASQSHVTQSHVVSLSHSQSHGDI